MPLVSRDERDIPYWKRRASIVGVGRKVPRYGSQASAKRRGKSATNINDPGGGREDDGVQHLLESSGLGPEAEETALESGSFISGTIFLVCQSRVH